MNYTENFEGIKIDVQAVDIDIDNVLQQRVRDAIVSLRRHISEINWVDVYFKEESQQSTNPRTLSIRLGVPGKEITPATGKEITVYRCLIFLAVPFVPLARILKSRFECTNGTDRLHYHAK
jgi:putative sigma-54 modulation protein